MTTMFRSFRSVLKMTWGTTSSSKKKGVDTENSRDAFVAVASAPLNSRNSVTVTANSTIWQKKEKNTKYGPSQKLNSEQQSAQDDFNVNGIFWHYCARCQWEMGGWGLTTMNYIHNDDGSF